MGAAWSHEEPAQASSVEQKAPTLNVTPGPASEPPAQKARTEVEQPEKELMVTVPPGMGPGGQFLVQDPGQPTSVAFPVVIPPDFKEGKPLYVEVPAAPLQVPAQAPAPPQKELNLPKHGMRWKKYVLDTIDRARGAPLPQISVCMNAIQVLLTQPAEIPKLGPSLLAVIRDVLKESHTPGKALLDNVHPGLHSMIDLLNEKLAKSPRDWSQTVNQFENEE